MIEKDRSFACIFRILFVVIMAAFIISEIVLPPESDSAFIKGEIVNTDRFLTYDQPVVWIVEDGTKAPVEVPGKYDVEPGTVMTLESVLPQVSDSDYFIMRASQQNMKIYVDGVLRVDYDTKDTRPSVTQTTSRYVFCKLAESDSNAVLKIELLSGAASYSGIVNDMYIGDKYSFWMSMLSNFGWDLIFGAVIIMFGICTILFSTSIRWLLKEPINLEYIGWGVLLTGVWLVGESRFRQVIAPNNSSLSNMCFIMLMLAPMPIALYLNSLQKFRYTKVYHGLIWLSLLNTAFSIVLQMTNLADFLDTMIISQALLVLTLLAAFVTFAADAHKKYLGEYKWECVGLIVVLILIVTEALSTFFITMRSGAFMTAAVVIMIIVSMVNTISNVEKKKREIENQKLHEEKILSDTMFMELIQTVADTLEAKDAYKNGHSRRVAEYSKRIAKKLGYKDEVAERLYYAVTLHDIGKIGVPDSLQNKPNVLSDEEYNVIKTHTIVGEDILKNVDLVSFTALIARSHHERYDGKGYPDGLSGEEIPFVARIVAVADSYDAMNSKRSYRDALTKDSIREEMILGSGTQFDPAVVQAFLELFDAGEMELGEDVLNKVHAAGSGQSGQMVSFIMDTFDSKMNTEGLDLVTGLPTRGVGEKKIASLMKEGAGALAFVDMDNLKKINDIHGHKAGDRALKLLGSVLAGSRKDTYACRIGGDEFLLYIKTIPESDTTSCIQDIMRRFEEEKQKDRSILDATLSIGICECTPDDDFTKILDRADKALYYVKQQGKNGYYYYHKADQNLKKSKHTVGLDRLVDSIKNAGKYEGAMDVEFREFAKVYEYISHLTQRHGYDCHLVMITLESKAEEMVDIDHLEQSVSDMGTAIRENIRAVDVCARYSSVQYLLILYEAKGENIQAIMQRIFSRFHEMQMDDDIEPTYVARKIY